MLVESSSILKKLKHMITRIFSSEIVDKTYQCHVRGDTMFTYRYTLYTMYTALYRFLSTLKYDDLCEYFAFHVNHAARKFD